MSPTVTATAAPHAVRAIRSGRPTYPCPRLGGRAGVPHGGPNRRPPRSAARPLRARCPAGFRSVPSIPYGPPGPPYHGPRLLTSTSRPNATGSPSGGVERFPSQRLAERLVFGLSAGIRSWDWKRSQVSWIYAAGDREDGYPGDDDRWGRRGPSSGPWPVHARSTGSSRPPPSEISSSISTLRSVDIRWITRENRWRLRRPIVGRSERQIDHVVAGEEFVGGVQVSLLEHLPPETSVVSLSSSPRIECPNSKVTQAASHYTQDSWAAERPSSRPRTDR